MDKINTYTRRPLTEEEVYTFNVVLCDNDIDRDGERFTEKALETLAALFVGKTGICDHDPKAAHQTARIFEATVQEDPLRQNALGAPYRYLLARAYMLKTDKTAPLIAEIDGGIKKEVSVGCRVKTRRCAVCGSTDGCAHRAGNVYEQKRCYFELDDPTDAYEWSFVAVPAQKNAGVVKAFGEDANTLLKSLTAADEVLLTREQAGVLKQHLDGMETLCALGKAYEAELSRRVAAQMTLKMPEIPASMLEKLTKSLSTDELKTLTALFDRAGDCQLAADNHRFKI